MDKFVKEMKKAKDVPETAAKAKMHVLKHLKKDAMDRMGDKLKQVTVAADSPSKLAKGLDVAKKVVEAPEMLGLDRSPAAEHGSDSEVEDVDGLAEGLEGGEEEGYEGSEEDMADDESMVEEALASVDTEEEIDSLIQKLMDKKKELQGSFA